MDGTLLDLRFDNWFWQEHRSRRATRRRTALSAERSAQLLDAEIPARSRAPCIGIASTTGARELESRHRGAEARRALRAGELSCRAREEFLAQARGQRQARACWSPTPIPMTLAIKNEQVAPERVLRCLLLDASLSMRRRSTPRSGRGCRHAEQFVPGAHSVRRRQPAGARRRARFRHRAGCARCGCRTRDVRRRTPGVTPQSTAWPS